MSEESKSHYEVLGVSPKATAREIHQAFRRLETQYRTTKGEDRPDAVARLKGLNAAHAVLGDRKKRRQYDAQGTEVVAVAELPPVVAESPKAVVKPAPASPKQPLAVRHLWLIGLILAVTFLALDSLSRIRTIDTVSDIGIENASTLVQDPNSLTGYKYNEHRLIVPAIGTDGYHYLMQTERMVAGVEGWRVRHVDYDNPPDGRDVHWSSLLHWVCAGVGWVGTKVTAIPFAPDSWLGSVVHRWFGPYQKGGLPMNLELSYVAPWANTLVLLTLIVVSVPVIARRFGPLSGALLGLGYVFIYPFYEYSIVGYFDHQGIAGSWNLFNVLCLVGGGVGWLRAEGVNPEKLSAEEQKVWAWLPDRPQARRWFLASAFASGGGLWVSAATTVPCMIGLGFGGLLATGWCARKLPANAPWRVDPTLWRVWGIASAAFSLFFYLVEYFPSHFTWRLEINHPLYALALLGAGDALCRLTRLIGGAPAGASQPNVAKEWAWIGLDALAVAVLPLTIALFGEKVFVIPDYFLWSLHNDYIIEFRSLLRQVGTLSTSEIISGISMIPLLVFPLAALIGLKDLPRPWRAVLLLGLFPAFIELCLAFKEIRWLGISCSLWLGTLVTTTAVLTRVRLLDWRKVLISVAVGAVLVGIAQGYTLWYVLLPLALAPVAFGLQIALNGFRRSEGFRTRLSICAGVFLALVFVPFSYTSLRQWMAMGLRLPVTQLDLSEVFTRDVSYLLRQRLGSERGVVISGPTTTTWMMFFGGFQGVGTLYWENIDGLKHTAAIYSASSADEARELVKKYGVTDIVIYSWDPFADEYAKLWRGLRLHDETPTDSFIWQVLHSGRLPTWLRPLPYRLPQDGPMKGQYVMILEVDLDQTPEEAAVNVAQFLASQNFNDQAETQLRDVLANKPNYLPALVLQARIQQGLGQADAFNASVQSIRDNLGQADTIPFVDRVNLAIVFALANDPGQTRAQITACLREATEKGIRQLQQDALYNFINLVRQTGLENLNPDVMKLAFSILPPYTQAQMFTEQAGAAARAGRFAEAVKLYTQALAVDPNNYFVLSNLAMILSAAPDKAVRDGALALTYAEQAGELDHFQHAQSYDTLACAEAASGNLDGAQQLEQKAIDIASPEEVGALRQRLGLFQKTQPAAP
jgi:tetratricopeptide (TPR) repeat protein